MSTWREDQRADRAAEREQDRQDRRLAAEEARKDRREKEKAKERRSQQRAERWARFRAWGAGRAAELPWLVIMGAPMVLSWSAMARYGTEVYGPVGVLLPLFSEAALLVFALAAARAAQRGEPTAVLRLGTAVFAIVTAALNFIHGADGEHGTITHGVVMAVVAVGGVAVHQIVHARQPRPRRTRAQRHADRLTRQAESRVYRLRRAAVRSATPVLAADGSVTLVYQSGALTKGRGPLRRWRSTVRPVEPTPDSLAQEVERWLAQGALGTTPHPSGTEETPSGTGAAVATLAAPDRPAGTADPRVAELAARVLDAIEERVLPAQPSRRKVQQFLKVRATTAQTVVDMLGLDKRH